MWKDHINQTVAKGSRSIGFLRRNHRECTQQVEAEAYTTLVRPVFEYASTVWDPYTHHQIHQIEMVQHQTARFVCGNYYNRDPGSVTNMLQVLGWETPEPDEQITE